MLCWLICLVGVHFRAFSQSTINSNVFAAYYTGAGPVLTTDQRVFDLPENATNFLFEFDFGFSTDEVVTNSVVFDSWTATLQTTNGESTVVYLTADVTGVQWAPPTPGTIPLDPSLIFRQPVAFPSLEPVFAQRESYHVSVPIPPSFSGQTVNFYFDLYDNLNSFNSVGWVSQINVVAVPEPASWSLGLAALTFMFWKRRLL